MQKLLVINVGCIDNTHQCCVFVYGINNKKSFTNDDITFYAFIYHQQEKNLTHAKTISISKPSRYKVVPIM